VLLNMAGKSSLKKPIIAQKQAQQGGASSPFSFYRTLLTQSVGTIISVQNLWERACSRDGVSRNAPSFGSYAVEILCSAS
jgi:hypothetical protein